ncbi:MAG: 8-oxo-dGTP diphosphatase [Candidatus Saccharimonadales bacterium]
MKDQTCTVAFLLRGNELLLARKKRGFGMGKWNGAGGKVEPSESLEVAMVRECQEELTVTPTVYERVAYHDFLLDADTAQPWHQFTYTYLVHDWQGEPAETEEMAPKWFTQNLVPYEAMWSDDIEWLPLVLAGKKLRTQFHFNHREQVIYKRIEEVAAL